jgi:uncharacterized protein with HEPN domain
MQPEERDAAYLWDMLQAATLAVKFVGPITLDGYVTDELVQAAVERKLEIIGEAARRVSEGFKTAHPEIPWKSIVSQRNFMAHEYSEVRPERIWGVVKVRLPELIAQVEPLLPPLPPELNL